MTAKKAPTTVNGQLDSVPTNRSVPDTPHAMQTAPTQRFRTPPNGPELQLAASPTRVERPRGSLEGAKLSLL
jgi:hypothetical protein